MARYPISIPSDQRIQFNQICICERNPEERSPLKMAMVVASVLVILVFKEVYSSLPGKCPISLPLAVLHKVYHPGDFIIGAILSQIYVFSTPATFERNPSFDVFDNVM